MSFFNKIWKNLREKPSASNNQKTSEKASSNAKLSRKCVTFYSELSLAQPSRDGFREQITFYERTLPVLKSHKENISPNECNQRSEKLEKDDTKDEDDIDHELFVSTSHENLNLPPMVIVRHPVGRAVSVSRSGRYKQKTRKRSNLFDFSPKRENEIDHEVFEYNLNSLEQDAGQTEIEVRLGFRRPSTTGSNNESENSSHDGREA